MDIVKKMLGKTIYYYYFNSLDGSGSGFKKFNHYSFKEHKVVFENSKNIVLDNEDLSTIRRTGGGYGIHLENPCISLRIADSYWGNTVDFLFYSEKLISTEEIKMMIMDEVARVTNSALSINLDGLDSDKMELKDE